MVNILVIAEVTNASVTRESLETVSLAMKLAAPLGQPVCGALLGAGDLSNAVAQFQCGFSPLLLLESPHMSTYLAQPFVAAAEAVIRKVEPSIVLFPHSARARDWAPQLAAKLRAGLVLDCVNAEVGEDGLTVTKPMYGGGVLGQLVVHGRPALMSVRGGVFEAAATSAGGVVERLEMPDLSPSRRVHYLESVPIEGGGGGRLKDAKTIVAGGRGTGGRENWHLIEEAAAATGAEIGCSRAIVDMGWLKWNHQVGLSGTIVAPDLYIAVGISGAVQHLAGISNAKTVVAINNDPEAEIFKRADYGVVGDFEEVLRAFVDRVREFRKS